MIADLTPYPNYRDSGLTWLERVPSHWGLIRTKAAVANVVEQTARMTAGDAYVALEDIESWTGRARPRQGTNLFVGQVKRFQAGDVLFGKLRPYLAKVTRLQSTGVCVGELFVLRPRDASLRADYLERQLRTKHTIDLVNSSTFGAKMPRADWQFLGNMPLLLPPPHEQAAIVRFLDWANGRIEKTIRAKRKVIALVNEQKQTIINRAVTRGTDPAVSLKPSGIDWLGNIPQHWTTTRIKYLLREVDERSTTGAEPLLSMRMHHGLVFFSEHFSRPPQAATLVGFKIVRPGQFVVNRMQAGNGLIFASRLTGLVSPDYAVLDPIGDANVEFLGELFRSGTVRTKFRAESKGLGTGSSGFLRLYSDRMGAIHVALPPQDEQTAILDRLGSDLAGLNAAFSRLEREIELLNEYACGLLPTWCSASSTFVKQWRGRPMRLRPKIHRPMKT